MSHFCKLVNDNEDSIIPTLGLRKSSNEVHFDMIKLPFWNSKEVGGDQLVVGVLLSPFGRHHIHSQIEKSLASFESTNTTT